MRALFFLLFSSLMSCKNNPPTDPAALENAFDTSFVSNSIEPSQKIRFSFSHENFYTLTSSDPQSQCAGDFIQATDALDASQIPLSQVPGFLRNVAVDLTNLSTPGSWNQASSCSAQPNMTSACATLNEDASASPEGSLLLLNSSSAGSSSLSTFKVRQPGNPAPSFFSYPESFPFQPWFHQLAWNPLQKMALVFGTGNPFSLQSWVYNVSQSEWTAMTDPPQLPSFLTQTNHYQNNTTSTLNQLPGGRSLFGYSTFPKMGLASLPSSPPNGQTSALDIDTTERLIIAGGLGNQLYCPNGGLCTDVHSFNPTYGPEYIDISSIQGPIDSKPTQSPHQWIQTSPQRLLSTPFENSTQHSSLNPTWSASGNIPPIYPAPQSGTASPPALINFGMAPLFTQNSVALLLLGGFYGYLDNTGEMFPDAANAGGFLKWLTRWGKQEANHFSFPTHYSTQTTLGGLQAAPMQVFDISPNSNPLLPAFGGGTLLPGFGPNEFVSIGGTDCRSYLLDAYTSSTCGSHPHYTPSPQQSSSYLFLPNPIPLSTSFSPTVTSLQGSLPSNAGMAVAKGWDASQNPLVVAWGGKKNQYASSTFDPGTSTFVLTHVAGRIPTWFEYPLTISPPPLANASLVFSHVTGKFYLFGGYGGATLGTSAQTWELSLTGACGTSSACTLQWQLLNPSCSPNCPTARRSHRMIEVNYHNAQPTQTMTCGPQNPCTFGLFMEGGSPNLGGYPLQDRWLFDPTASNGQGLWQLMTEFPARRLQAMTDLSLSPINPQTGLTRPSSYALLFGGETGLEQDPLTLSESSFLAPILGDTWWFDYQKKLWVKPKLLGARYLNTIPSGLTELEQQGSSLVGDPSSVLLAPPPLSGGLLITRTLQRPQNDPLLAAQSLTIPEAFLLGGRLKTGELMSLGQVFKFCAGTSGEDATGGCYHSQTLPTTEPVGRWLFKNPGLPPGLAHDGLYLGAGSYDSAHDRLLIFGGLSLPTGRKITETTALSSSSAIYEYTPPSSPTSNGSWSTLPPCPASPTPALRYGHQAYFDLSHQGLIVLGGFELSGTPLQDIWLAQRQSDSTPNCYQWKALTTPPEFSALTGYQKGVFIPRTQPNTGFYTLSDTDCTGYGPLSSSLPGLINRQQAGGVNIDLDRSQLGSQENVLMNLTYLPFNSSFQQSNGKNNAPYDVGFFKIHLLSVDGSTQELRSVPQPRYLTYTDPNRYPRIFENFHQLSAPGGQIRSEQILIPLAQDIRINRIRLERFSGSGILIDVSLYRLGQK